MHMHVAVNAGGPSYFSCSRTCTDYREHNRPRADSCAEVRRVPISLAGPNIFQHNAPSSHRHTMQKLSTGSLQNSTAL